MLALWYPVQHSLGPETWLWGIKEIRKDRHTGAHRNAQAERLGLVGVVDSDGGQLLYKDPEPQHIYYMH